MPASYMPLRRLALGGHGFPLDGSWSRLVEVSREWLAASLMVESYEFWICQDIFLWSRSALRTAKCTRYEVRYGLAAPEDSALQGCSTSPSASALPAWRPTRRDSVWSLLMIQLHRDLQLYATTRSQSQHGDKALEGCRRRRGSIREPNGFSNSRRVASNQTFHIFMQRINMAILGTSTWKTAFPTASSSNQSLFQDHARHSSIGAVVHDGGNVAYDEGSSRSVIETH
jgi:hypothetical protein